jgi:DNA-binding CsgD family transcriptional regulator/PAS domain-containing protein
LKHLSHSDLQVLLSAINNLNSDLESQTLPERALSAASQVIAADSVAFTGFTYSGEFTGLGWENSGEISPADLEVFAQYVHENPLVSAFLYEHRRETLKITDLISPEKFHRTNVYNEFYRRVNVGNQLVAPLVISDELFMSCSINTDKEDFSERDKSALTLLAPHLVNAVRNAFAYERLNSALETENCGIVAVDSKGKPLFVSRFARRLFKQYFADEKCGTDSLPETLRAWIKQIDLTVRKNEFNLPPQPLKAANRNGELIIRFVYNTVTRERTLMLEEKRLASQKILERFQITKREAEILFWIMQGKTDNVIAALCGISPRTVQKHAENIYRKLGVETRTGAMLKASEIE